MANKDIAAWAEQNNAPVRNNTVFLERNGFLLTYSTFPNNMLGISTFIQEDNWNKELQQELKQSLKRVGTLAYGKGAKGLLRVLITAATRAGRMKKLDEATEILLSELTRLQVLPCDACCFCGGSECDDNALHQAVYSPAHKSCKEQRVDEILTDIEDNEATGSVFMGVIGAIIGGLVGSIPSFITIYYMDMIAALLFALIPLAAYYGYKLFNGRMTGAVRYIVSGISLICTVVLVFVSSYMFFIEGIAAEMPEYEQALASIGYTPLQLFMEVLSTPELRGDLSLFSAVGMPLLFCILGISIAWRSISRSNKQKRAEAQMLSGEKM